MSGKGEYFRSGTFRALLGAEVLLSVKEVFGESVPGLLPRPHPQLTAVSLGRLCLTVAGRKVLRASGDARAWSGRVVIFSRPHPVEAFQRLFII